MDLSTTYLGLKLSHPLIAGASPLADDVDKVKRLEDAGAAAIVLSSLFEEQVILEQNREVQNVESAEGSFAEALSYFPRRDEFRVVGPDRYLEKIRTVKEAVSMPVIASLNGVTTGGWTDYARACQEAGADALELNVYYLPTSSKETGADVEKRALEVVAAVRQSIRIPLAVKLSPFYSSLPHFVTQVEAAGADGVVLFNRFYQPDIDPEALEVVSKIRLSDPSELLLRLRWLALLWGRVKLCLGVTGGVHSAGDAIKAIMAGAHGVQMVSALLKNGAEHVTKMKGEMANWLDAHEYSSLDQVRGSMSLLSCPDPSAFERANYLKVLHAGRA